MRNFINFLGVNVDTVDTEGLYQRVVEFVNKDRPYKIMYVNADCILNTKKDAEYRRILNNADLVYADGVGVAWGAKCLGQKLPSRSTAADFMPDFFQRFAEQGYRVYLLGARPSVILEVAGKLRKTIPKLNIVGASSGYFEPHEIQKVTDDILQAKPDILLVGMGAPIQEKWIEENSYQLNVPVVWGVGGLFDFLSGQTKRGPQWLLDHGFEWLCRLFIEPRRLWRRYLIGNTKFIFYLVQHRLSLRKDPFKEKQPAEYQRL